MVATSRVFFFRFASRDFFPISARGTRRRSRVGWVSGCARMDGWTVSSAEPEPSRVIMSSSSVTLREVGIWIVSIRVGRRGDDESAHRARRLIGRLRSQSHPGRSVGFASQLRPSSDFFETGRARAARRKSAQSSDERNETNNSFTDAKRCALRARKLERTKLTTTVLLPRRTQRRNDDRR